MSGTDMYEGPVPMHAESARPESVLVVDDENGVRDLMSRWLEARWLSR